jgi:rubrerythrin
MLAQARADRMPEAVRSMNYALGAERDHARFLAAALATLEARPAAPAYYVCPGCGHTVESIPSGKCAHCFTGANRFMAVN